MVVSARARRLVLVALVALVLVPGAAASGSGSKLTDKQATAIFLRNDKVVDWLARYPKKGRTTDASYNSKFRLWTIKVWWGAAGEIATGRVDDRTSQVTEAWTGPQVAWTMARGGSGAFGGKLLNKSWVWLGLCMVFLLGLGNLRRPLSLRNLDLLVLVGFTASLWYFNDGDIFTAVPIVYPLLLYLTVRCVLIGLKRGRSEFRPVWPVWVLAAATIFLIGFRIGLNVEAPNSVIDVGYSGVIGAERIVHGEAPYGHMPVEDSLKPCGPSDLDGEIRDRIQTNGRCESADPQGDTYGPVSYEAYIPAYGIFGWSGKWDSLPAGHAASILFDLLCILGLALVGRRFGGLRLAATLAFAWAAFPFTAYVLNSNTNDAIMPCFLIYGFWLVTSPWARGAAVSLAVWTKFAAAVVAPLWLGYPDWKKRRPQERFLIAFILVSLAAFFVLLLEPNPIHAAHVFWDRTIWSQVQRSSPFSIWDWRQYHAAGIPNLHAGQYVCEALLVIGAIAAYFYPRRKSPLQLAALTGALMLGFELCLTHWFYLYIPWFFPFTAIALLVPPARVPVPAAEEEAAREHGPREALVPAG